MIGALLASRFIAKKPWTISALFWAILFVIGIVLGTVIGPHIIILFIMGFIVFVGVAMYYLKVTWWLGIIMYFASWIFNLIIGFLLGAAGIILPW